MKRLLLVTMLILLVMIPIIDLSDTKEILLLEIKRKW